MQHHVRCVTRLHVHISVVVIIGGAQSQSIYHVTISAGVHKQLIDELINCHFNCINRVLCVCETRSLLLYYPTSLLTISTVNTVYKCSQVGVTFDQLKQTHTRCQHHIERLRRRLLPDRCARPASCRG
jgi:hypothetical protein